jgi:rsbT co-antagonist protein RsbR
MNCAIQIFKDFLIDREENIIASILDGIDKNQPGAFIKIKHTIYIANK